MHIPRAVALLGPTASPPLLWAHAVVTQRSRGTRILQPLLLPSLCRGGGEEPRLDTARFGDLSVLIAVICRIEMRPFLKRYTVRISLALLMTLLVSFQ